MAEGNPLLAVWGSGTLRTFELSGSAFVQIGSVALSVAVGVPDLYWIGDGARIGAARMTSSTVIGLSQYTPALSSLGSTTSTVPSGTPLRSGFFQEGSVGYMLIPSGTAGTWKWVRFLSSSSVIAAGTNAAVGLNGPSTTAAIRMSPDGQRLTQLNSSTETPLRAGFRNGVDVNNLPQFTAGNVVGVPYMTNGTYTPDSRLLITVSGATAYVFVKNGNTWSFESSFSAIGLTARAIAASYDNRTLAISYTGGATTYVTRIYKRTGYTYEFQEELPSIGNLLSFSADGSILIDAAERKAWKLSSEGGWEDVSSTMMANIPAGGTSQAVSPHMISPTAGMQLYDGALNFFLQTEPSAMDMKLMLLNGSAAFNHANTTVSQVTSAGAYEVYGNGWPQGGVELLNPNLVAFGSTAYALKVDPVLKVLFGGNLVVRYGLVYSGTTPLAFMDLHSEKTFAANSEVGFQTGPAGLLLYSL